MVSKPKGRNDRRHDGQGVKGPVHPLGQPVAKLLLYDQRTLVGSVDVLHIAGPALGGAAVW